MALFGAWVWPGAWLCGAGAAWATEQAYFAHLALSDIDDHPHQLMVSDPEQNVPRRRPHAVHGVAFEYLAVLRSEPRNRKGDFATTFQAPLQRAQRPTQLLCRVFAFFNDHLNPPS